MDDGILFSVDDNHIAITGGTVCVDSAGGGCGLGGCAPGTKLVSAVSHSDHKLEKKRLN